MAVDDIKACWPIYLFLAWVFIKNYFLFCVLWVQKVNWGGGGTEFWDFFFNKGIRHEDSCKKHQMIFWVNGEKFSGEGRGWIHPAPVVKGLIIFWFWHEVDRSGYLSPLCCLPFLHYDGMSGSNKDQLSIGAQETEKKKR